MNNLVIDPGHGGEASGTTAGGIVEDAVNLKLALDLRRLIKATGWPVVTLLTRETDEALGLDARGAFSERVDADLVLSIHVNASPSPTTRGLMTFVRDGDDVADSIAVAIGLAAPAELRRQSFYPVVATRHDWTRNARAVLAPHHAPAVLVEVGFATNARDRRVIQSPSGQAALVAAMLCGVARLLQLKEAAPAA